VRRDLVLELELGTAISSATTVAPDDNGKVARHGTHVLRAVDSVARKRIILNIDLGDVRTMGYVIKLSWRTIEVAPEQF
jgi:hypothetical protein